MGHIKENDHPHGGFDVWVDDGGEEHEILNTCPHCGCQIGIDNEQLPDQELPELKE